MSRTAIIMVLMIVVFGAAALAEPVDPDPDGMGFYFDTEGHDYLVQANAWEPAIGAGPTFVAYLLLTRPSTTYPYVYRWEAHVEFESNSYTPPRGLTLTADAVDLDDDPDDYEVRCAGPAAIPITGDVVLLASVEFDWLGFEGYADATIFLEGIEGSASFPEGPGYVLAGGLLKPCQSYFNYWGGVAWIQSTGIGNEGMTWGMVKSLY